jgi:V8-like Glu-specific endopeptidase
MTAFSEQLKTLIAEDELELAVTRLVNYLKGSAPDLVNEVVLYSAQLARLRREARSQLLVQDDVRRQSARIAAGLLDFIDELPRRMERRCRFPVVTQVPLNVPDDVRLEKIFGVNHLKSIAWLEHGLLAARSVCRIVGLRSVGSGFLVAGGFVITNNHVLADASEAAASIAEFGFEEDSQGKVQSPTRYQLDPETFQTSVPFDVSIVRVIDDGSSLGKWGELSFTQRLPALRDHVSIIQHPDGGPKMIALTANQVVNVFEHRLQYLTDTLPGSSGSPVFDDNWLVVAVHHAGGNLVANTAGDRRFANEGVLASYIVEALRIDLGGAKR